MSSEKPREPRVWNTCVDDEGYLCSCDENPTAKEEVWVIEKSAYDALKLEETKMLARLHRQSGILVDLEQECDRLRCELSDAETDAKLFKENK